MKAPNFWAWLKCLFGFHNWSTHLDLMVWTSGTEPYYDRVEGFVCKSCGDVEVINSLGIRMKVDRDDVANIPGAKKL